jgi:hypothetical protein
MKTASLHRVVRLTARTSAVLFTSAQVAQALGMRGATLHPPSAWRLLYLAFVSAHATHFAAVARFAHQTGGRALFPGGRDMKDVGGWPALFGIFAFFFALATTGWIAAGSVARGRPVSRGIGSTATALIGAMFVSFYWGQVPQNRWYTVPGAIISAAVLSNVASAARPFSPGGARC